MWQSEEGVPVQKGSSGTAKVAQQPQLAVLEGRRERMADPVRAARLTLCLGVQL